MLKKIESAISTIRNNKPLVINFTNFVTMDLMANSMLAIGASPLMSVEPAEFEELLKIAKAVNINIGTLDQNFINNAYQLAKLAKLYNIPLILDPVGAGASLIRTTAARKLLPYATIVRGNASEIMALHNDQIIPLGTQAIHNTSDAQDIAKKLAKFYRVITVVSGHIDFITDGLNQQYLNYGANIMSQVTGMGCALNSIIAAFRAVIDNSFEASLLATAYFSLCASLAASKSKATGSFRTKFIDELYNSNFNQMEKITC